jgi:hypothetical protein
MTRAKCPWQAASVLLLLVSGCGAQYRPVVTPLTPTGPASQPSAYFIAISSPSATEAGLATIIDAFGDTVLAQASLSNNPFAFVLSSSAGSGYNLNGNETATDGVTNPQGSFTLDSYEISTTGTSSLRTQNVSSSTIPALAYPFNGISTTSSFYLTEPYIDPATGVSTSAAAGKPANSGYVAQLTGSVPALQQEIQVAPNPVNFAGTSAGPRLYAISQGNSTAGALATANACNTPGSVTTNGEADSIEVTTNTVSNRIPVGICPVYGIESADFERAFILNRGSGNITVINAQSNALDTVPATGTSTITTGAGPVYADLYIPSSLLVTANYDSNSVSVINVPTDQYGNDGPNFGTVKTIALPQGTHPIALTILRDGSRAYVADAGDANTPGYISVVNLSTFTVTKTIALGVNSSGASVHPSSIASVYSTPTGAVYVASRNSNSLTVINTETDTLSSAVTLPANAVSVYSTTQNVSASSSVNQIVNSNASGLGIPCGIGDTTPFCATPAQ